MNSITTTTNITGISMERVPMTSLRKTALAAGALYLLTFVSIPTLALYGAIHDPNYIVGRGPDTEVIIGGILEIIVALAGIGTAVALYPVLRKQNEGVALGLVGSRVLEAGTMFAGVAFLLTVVALRQAGAGADAVIIGQTLVTLYDRIFLIGQSFMPAVNDLLLGFLLYQSRLVPRSLSLIGLIGAILLVAGDIAVLFGLIGQHAPSTALAAIPVALFEFSLGVWLVVKGFKPSPITAGM
ncbi:MAG TPA: DUF4386 domain-containing protein [Cyclobacteriaceae bacterium]|nr:DUF4386 domain-containing protein [Cyclobacteriaceae bacterium]